jgi:AraC-like DNA-binding protein
MRPTAHIDRIHAAIETGVDAHALGNISDSWRRSLNDYSVDPESAEPPRILTARELKDFRAPLETLVDIGRGELHQLYSLVREVHYVVLLCDANGIAIDHRGNEAEADRFKYCGIWLGGVWSENVEGTNGIGTCVNELRPITVHRDEHFRARHIGLSCSGAPIFDPEGKLIAVLDVSSMDPEISEQTHALSLPITVKAARAIEERLFRYKFKRRWTIAVSGGDGADFGALLMAVDADQRVVGADRKARLALGLGDEALRNGVSLWTLFERDPSVFRRVFEEDVPAQLRRIGDEAVWRAIVTSPPKRNEAFDIWPRIALLADIPPFRPRGKIRGGLSPSVLRRVETHIDAHLRERVGLEALAGIAGLSVWHFARAFKQAIGVTPYEYLLQRRIERARDMLIRTDMSLSAIAAAVGFSDHSHFTRHFRRRTGMTPSLVRRNARDPRQR